MWQLTTSLIGKKEALALRELVGELRAHVETLTKKVAHLEQEERAAPQGPTGTNIGKDAFHRQRAATQKEGQKEAWHPPSGG